LGDLPSSARYRPKDTRELALELMKAKGMDTGDTVLAKGAHQSAHSFAADAGRARQSAAGGETQRRDGVAVTKWLIVADRRAFLWTSEIVSLVEVAIQFRFFLCLQYVVGFVETHSTCRGHFESFFSAAAGKPFAPAWTGKLVLSKERLPLRWAYPETRGNRLGRISRT